MNFVNTFNFSQSKRSDVGIKRQKTRIETANVIVATDGTGDFDNIQSAINFLKNGGLIQVKEGEYEVKETIVMKSNIYLIGSGIVKLWSDEEEFVFLESTVLCENVLIENIFFSGQDLVQTGLKFSNLQKSMIRNNSFLDFDICIYINGSNVEISGNKLKENTTFCSSFLEITDGNFAIFNNSIETTECSDAIYSWGVATLGTRIFGNSFHSGDLEQNANDASFIITNNYFFSTIKIKGDNNIVLGNVAGAISNTGTNNIIEHNQI